MFPGLLSTLFVYDDFLLLCMLVVDDIYVAAHHDDPDVIYSVSLHHVIYSVSLHHAEDFGTCRCLIIHID